MIYFRRNHSRHVLILNCISEFSGFEKKAYHLKRKEEWLLKVVYWPFYPPCNVETIPRTSKMGNVGDTLSGPAVLSAHCSHLTVWSHRCSSCRRQLGGTECFVRFQIHRGNSQEAGRRIAIENPRSARICCRWDAPFKIFRRRKTVKTVSQVVVCQFSLGRFPHPNLPF